VDPEAASGLALGLLLFGTLLGGRLARRAGLPTMTGQLAAGFTMSAIGSSLVAPASGFLELLRLALGAGLLFWVGSRISIPALRATGRATVSLAATVVVSVPVCVITLRMLAHDDLVVSSGAMELALLLSATSPTVVAVLACEHGGSGTLSRAGLQASVVVNVAILVSLAVLFGAHSETLAQSRSLGHDLAAGLTVGGALGLLIALSPGRASGGMIFAFVLLAGLVLRHQLVHHEGAILAGALVAGTAVASTGDGHPVLAAVARAVPTTSAILFAVTGALADLHLVAAMAAPAAAVVGVRALSLWLGSHLTGRIAGDPLVQRFGFAPLLPQAGFSIALAGTLDALGLLSPARMSLVIAVVVLNELVMPPVLRLALRRSDPSPVAA
jgi:Kef-type K+ transport system membrane component KefB